MGYVYIPEHRVYLLKLNQAKIIKKSVILFWLLNLHSLHEIARKHNSDLNSSVLVTVWRVVIQKGVTGLPTK